MSQGFRPVVIHITKKNFFFSFFQTYSYVERASLCKHCVTKQLFTIMDKKKSNLALSVDLTKASQVLDVSDSLSCLMM